MATNGTTISVQASAVPKPKVRVGFNYPWAWNQYGLYFGGGSPPGSNAFMDKWTDSLRNNLKTLHDECRIDLVRIFLFCNLANIGGSIVRSGTTKESFNDTFNMPQSLHPNFIKHLTDMLAIFQAANMQVLPSLVDFGAILRVFRTSIRRKDGTTQGSGCTNHYEIVTNQQKGEAFLELVLKPCLQASAPYSGQIYAWEVMNEPSWAAGDDIRSDFGQVALQQQDVAGFLSMGVAMIENFEIAGKKIFAGRSTVGHRFASDLDIYPTGAIRQYHYYPSLARYVPDWALKFFPRGDEELKTCFATGGAILGEFEGAGPLRDKYHILWPDIPDLLQQTGADICVQTRLELIQEKGYKIALMWPELDAPESGYDHPDILKITKACKNGLERYCPPLPASP